LHFAFFVYFFQLFFITFRRRHAADDLPLLDVLHFFFGFALLLHFISLRCHAICYYAITLLIFDSANADADVTTP